MTNAEELSVLRSAIAGSLRPSEVKVRGLDARRFSTPERQAIFALVMAYLEMTGRVVSDTLLLRASRAFEDSTVERMTAALAEIRSDPAERERVRDWDEVLP